MFTRKYLIIERAVNPGNPGMAPAPIVARCWTRRGGERACLRRWARDGFPFPMRYRVWTDAEA